MSAAAPGTTARPNAMLLPVLPREMTSCECTGVAFAEIARRMAVEGKSAEELMAEMGVGGTCTACVQDLRAFLARLARSPD